MNCVSPPELDDRQLLASLDGEASPLAAAHLEACPACRARRAQLTRQQNRLAARLFRAACPSTVELGDYHLGLLPVERAAAVARHVLECPRCTREVAELRGFMSPLAPPHAAGPLENLQVLVARWLGAPAEGGLASPGLAVLRGDSPGPLTLEADGILILLDVQLAEGGLLLDLHGQVAAPDQDRWTGAGVELRQGGERQGRAVVDELGAFRLVGISPGPVELQLLPQDGPLVVAKFDVTA